MSCRLREPQLQERQEALAAGQDLADPSPPASASASSSVAGALVGERCRDHAWPPFADWIARHTVWGVYGMSRWRMPSGLSASMTALATAAVLAIAPGLADALDAERVDRRRRDRLVELEVREARGPRQRVVEHRARQELALVAVDRALPERLADALGDAAVELAVDDHRVDLLADVIDGDVADQVDAPVSSSISTIAMCVPNGQVQFGVS